MLGRETQLATPEPALDGLDFAGSCDEGFSRARTNTIARVNEATPLPMEIDPRVVFERLFGDSGSTDPAVRKARLARDARLLDSVTERVRAPSREIGVPDAHHPISHHARDSEKLEKLRKINRCDVELVVEFIERLASTPEGDGALLDHSMIVHGDGMSESHSHGSTNLPILLAGGPGRGARYVSCDDTTPLANLHMSLLDRMGVPIDSLGDATGRLELEPLSDVWYPASIMLVRQPCRDAGLSSADFIRT